MSYLFFSLPFLIFSGPITDLVGHINVIIIGMVAYFVRMIGYSFLQVKNGRENHDSNHYFQYFEIVLVLNQKVKSRPQE